MDKLVNGFFITLFVAIAVYVLRVISLFQSDRKGLIEKEVEFENEKLNAKYVPSNADAILDESNKRLDELRAQHKTSKE